MDVVVVLLLLVSSIVAVALVWRRLRGRNVDDVASPAPDDGITRPYRAESDEATGKQMGDGVVLRRELELARDVLQRAERERDELARTLESERAQRLTQSPGPELVEGLTAAGVAELQRQHQALLRRLEQDVATRAPSGPRRWELNTSFTDYLKVLAACLAAHLPESRHDRGKVADRAGVSLSTIETILRAEGNSTLHTLYSIANARGLRLSVLFAEAEDRLEAAVAPKTRLRA